MILPQVNIGNLLPIVLLRNPVRRPDGSSAVAPDMGWGEDKGNDGDL